MERAQEIKDSLPLSSPSFVKNLLRSHVTLGFWLGLPKQFCVDHLPKLDETVILVAENEEKEHYTNYLMKKKNTIQIIWQRKVGLVVGGGVSPFHTNWPRETFMFFNLLNGASLRYKL